MTALFAARLSCVLVVLALQPTQAAATAGPAAGPVESANAPVLPVVRLATTDKLYVRGADLAIISSGACSLLAQAERRECLARLSDEIAPLPPAASPSPD